MITLKLTPRQAAMIYRLFDMQLDTGCCEGGNTRTETATMRQLTGKLLELKPRWYDRLGDFQE